VKNQTAFCVNECPNEDIGPLQIALVSHHHNDTNSLKSYLAGVYKCLANQSKTMASCGTNPGEPEPLIPHQPTWTNPCDMNGICCPPDEPYCD
jgi:hypothetical protein